MAKKKTALSIEERLQQALVPKEEQPYEVPENWVWVRLGSISDTISKGTTPKGGKAAYTNNGVKFLRIENITDNGTISHDSMVYVNNETHNKFLKRSILQENDVLISIAGTLGKTGIVRKVDLPINTNQAICFVRLKTSVSFPCYIKTVLESPIINDALLSQVKVTSIPNLTLEIIYNCNVPIPPLQEQHRIVARIEELFAKLDEAKENLQEVLDGFETRKAAILHKAFTGELTKKWREEHGVGMDSWEDHLLKDVCDVNPKKGDVKNLPDQLIVSFIPMAAVSDVKGCIVEPQIKALGEVKKGFTNFCEGDVIFAKITPCMENGKSAVVGKLVHDIGFGSTEFYVLRASVKLYNYYLYHFVRSSAFRNLAKGEMTGAVGQQRVPKSFIENFTIHLPSLDEQQEIVRIVDSLLDKEQKAKEAAESVLEQIDLMKKSILARAFRGELGTNDPAEPTSMELLKQVLADEE